MFDLDTIKRLNDRAVEKSRRATRRLYSAAVVQAMAEGDTDYRRSAARTVRASRRARTAALRDAELIRR